MQSLHLKKRLQEFIATSSRPLIVVLGPTASGKTSFSIELASHLGDVEIINADSRQLYKYLDIGTAKITKNDMRGIPHHLLDVVDPKQEVTAADYQTMAEEAIRAIRSRGKTPMLVGGSMLHISSIIDGLRFPSAPDSDLRQRLSAEYDADGGARLYAKLKEIDPETAEAFSVANKPYVVRAMEIWESTGEKPSIVRTRGDSAHDLFIIGIMRSAKELSHRIEERTTAMMEGGWIEEVRGLLERGYGPDDPGMKSHGYREIMGFLSHGSQAHHDIAFLAKTIATKTRQYAKRQMTWWRRDQRINWIVPA